MITKTHLIALLISVLGITGCLINGFAGGCITGFSISILIASTLGKYLAVKALKTIDKNIKDQILHRQNN